MANQSDKPSVGLDLAGDRVPAEQFLEAVQDFLDILRDVDTQTTQRAGGSLNWIVKGLSGGSAHVEVMPEAKDEWTPFGAATAVVRNYAAGMALIATEGVKPPFFTDRAVRKARALTALVSEGGITGVSFRVGTERIALTKAMTARAVEHLEGQLTAIGSVEGVLKTISVHGAPYFNVYDSVTGSAIRCTFPRDLLEKAKSALTKRVMVRGTIHTRPNGDITSVRVKDLEVFPEESDLPTAEMMRGILNHG